MNQKRLSIALAGNPNSGKTTIFNNLTGTRQKVGNWPGVTVEKKEGNVKKFGYDLKIIDLPGTYSLTPFTIEEIIARDFVLEERPDVVIADHGVSKLMVKSFLNFSMCL
jgi:ferrous iron transport protein B